MTTVFFVAFGIGAGFVLISFLIGEFSGEIETDSTLSFIKPSVISTFLVVFGITGILLEISGVFYGFAMVSFGIAFFAGFITSLALNRFILIPLRRLENTSAADRQMLIGQDAQVIEKIPQGGFGKITFSINGNKHNAPAKAEDGSGIERHQTVEIIYIEKSTYFVRVKKK